jgi:hypothetical protein
MSSDDYAQTLLDILDTSNTNEAHPNPKKSPK